MNVTGGSTDVTTYFVLRLAATGVEATGLTITNFDLQYTRSGVAPTAKVDATALAATDTAHTDNYAIEIDATDQPGLYRVDWPDAAFAAGVKEVILTVKCATCFTEHLRVTIDSPVNVTNWLGTACATPTVAGVPEVDMTHINGGATSGNNATLSLKSLNIQSANSTPLYIASTSTNNAPAAEFYTEADATGYAAVRLRHAGSAGYGLEINGGSGDAIRLTTAGTGKFCINAVPSGSATDSNLEVQATDGSGAALATAASVAALPNAVAIATAVWAVVVVGSYTAIQIMRGLAAALLGKLSGAGTNTETIRAADDSKDVITATVDASGNRTTVTKDLT